MQEVSDDETSASKSGIATGDRRGNDSEKGKDASEYAQPSLLNGRDHGRSRCAEIRTDLGSATVEEEV